MDLAARAAVCIGIISDTHGSIERHILHALEGCDVVVHAGDILGSDVLRQIAPQSGHVLAVRGNNDTPEQWPAGTQHLLDALPETLSLALPGGMLVVEHGHRVHPAHQRHQKLRLKHPDARAIVYGHTHWRVIDQTAPIWVLNPGAAGRIRAHGGASCLILHATAHEWTVRAVPERA
ncbi:metallophosphoesterase family protein [Halothiobacillus sp. DCM-1]|uniref:metallophosphoesterase family protein n=1 Tax=Halothiobacillus sp. DCM-1 TaxID=3112558 RepID=UPI0032518ADF